MAISKFRKENFFLSNMYPFENGIPTPDGQVVFTSEQLYLSSRFASKAARITVQQARDGFSAKRLTKSLEYSGSPTWAKWKDLRDLTMRDCVVVKFVANPDIAQKLLATGEEEIIEGNDRGDRYWGVSPSPGKPGSAGENRLGVILMDTRIALADPNFNINLEGVVNRIFTRVVDLSASEQPPVNAFSNQKESGGSLWQSVGHFKLDDMSEYTKGRFGGKETEGLGFKAFSWDIPIKHDLPTGKE